MVQVEGAERALSEVLRAKNSRRAGSDKLEEAHAIRAD
jgi:hypothetical protein